MRYLDSDCPPDGITVSSDGGGCLPVFDEQGAPVGLDYARASALPEALKNLIDHGVPLETVLPAFTSNVARILRLAYKGSISAGMDADFVLLGEDGRPRHVMARGTWHVHDYQSVIKGTFE